MRGPKRVPIWGERREYTWFIRDGFFVRSPTKFNGVDHRRGRAPEVRGRLPQAGAGARQERATRRQRDARRLRPHDRWRHRRRPPERPATGSRRTSAASFARTASRNSSRRPTSCASSSRRASTRWSATRRSTAATCCASSTTRTRMFSGTDRRRTRQGTPPTTIAARDAEFQRLMNKVALVTLWVEPKAHQIVKYTFDNVGFDFLPAQWLVHVSDVKATMTVGPAVSRRVAADQHGDQPRDDAGRRPVRRALRPRVSRLPRAERHQQSRRQVADVGAAGPASCWRVQARTRPTAPETVAAIQIQGNTATPDEEVRRLADVRVGMPFDATTVDAVATRLRAAKKFESVEVRKRFASIADPSQIALVIIVDEGPVKIVMTGDPDSPDARRAQAAAQYPRAPDPQPRGRLRLHLRRAPDAARSELDGEAQPHHVSADLGRDQAGRRRPREAASTAA